LIVEEFPDLEKLLKAAAGFRAVRLNLPENPASRLATAFSIVLPILLARA
jgi:hypothetical protein